MKLPLSPPFLPQLARSRESLPEGPEWAYEPKWDGFRAIAFVDGAESYLQSRNGRPLTRYFPEVSFPEGRYVLDGELVILGRDGGQDFELLAFGTKIVRRHGAPRVEHILVTEPIEGSRQEIVDPSQLGNTRHLSATQFVSDQRDAIALVASQDGRFTVFAWSPLRDIVHARRLEALLL